MELLVIPACAISEFSPTVQKSLFRDCLMIHIHPGGAHQCSMGFCWNGWDREAGPWALECPWVWSLYEPPQGQTMGLACTWPQWNGNPMYKAGDLSPVIEENFFSNLRHQFYRESKNHLLEYIAQWILGNVCDHGHVTISELKNACLSHRGSFLFPSLPAMLHPCPQLGKPLLAFHHKCLSFLESQNCRLGNHLCLT